MEILETQVYRGANYWAPVPAIRLLLDIGELEERPTNQIPGFYEKLTTTLPTMYDHRCSVGKPGGFFQRLREGTWMGHVVEHTTLELQNLAGQEVGYGKARSATGPGSASSRPTRPTTARRPASSTRGRNPGGLRRCPGHAGLAAATGRHTGRHAGRSRAGVLHVVPEGRPDSPREPSAGSGWGKDPPTDLGEMTFTPGGGACRA